MELKCLTTTTIYANGALLIVLNLRIIFTRMKNLSLLTYSKKVTIGLSVKKNEEKR